MGDEIVGTLVIAYTGSALDVAGRRAMKRRKEAEK
jgi:hypothetical protein